ncbi:hypothetical protein TSUD_184020 [Trifolium subterraneum]|uniref:Uncharacterized protein n=1 Tax=Trifolium subterraneum TaxID=3900 RepID=A0A2Z6LUI9_TRISU|nr:hypothetical protein TSUD_184020 [Trifolium subterraneum]
MLAGKYGCLQLCDAHQRKAAIQYCVYFSLSWCRKTAQCVLIPNGDGRSSVRFYNDEVNMRQSF